MSTEMKVVAQYEPDKMHKFVQILSDGSTFICDLPIGDKYNDGTGIIFYKNKGFIPFDVYEAEQHKHTVIANQKAAKDKK